MTRVKAWLAEVSKYTYYFDRQAVDEDLTRRTLEHLISLGADRRDPFIEWVSLGKDIGFYADHYAARYSLSPERLLEPGRVYPAVDGSPVTLHNIGSCVEVRLCVALDGRFDIFGVFPAHRVGDVAVRIGTFEELMTIILEDVKLGMERFEFQRQVEEEDRDPRSFPERLEARNPESIVHDRIREFERDIPS